MAASSPCLNCVTPNSASDAASVELLGVPMTLDSAFASIESSVVLPGVSPTDSTFASDFVDASGVPMIAPHQASS